jgi:ribosomal protein S8
MTHRKILSEIGKDLDRLKRYGFIREYDIIEDRLNEMRIDLAKNAKAAKAIHDVMLGNPKQSERAYNRYILVNKKRFEV